MKHLSKPVTVLMLFLLTALAASTQTLTNAEFFWDKEPGVGNGQPLLFIPADSLTREFDISPAGLSAGFHQLFIRVKNSAGKWSIAEQRTININGYLAGLQPLKSAEYFIDKDPGTGYGKPLSISAADSVNTLLDISATGLSSGFHHLFIRTVNSTNSWSIAEERVFYIDNKTVTPPSPIVTGEYFVDSDAGTGNNKALTLVSGDSVEMTYAYTAKSLSFGKHTMNLRVKDSLGNWSYVESRPFVVCTTYGPISAFDYTQESSNVQFINQSQYAGSGHWNFGDGKSSDSLNPRHYYTPGNYNVCLVSKNACDSLGDTLCKTITVTNSTLAEYGNGNLSLQCKNGNIYLNWDAPEHAMMNGFEVEKSRDGLTWSSIGSAFYKQSSEKKSFTFTDNEAAKAFYRIEAIYNNEKRPYSKTLTADCISSLTTIRIDPVPANALATVTISLNKNRTAVMNIINDKGQVLYKQKALLLQGVNNLLINVQNLPAGLYFVRLQDGTWSADKKMIIAH